MRRSLSLLSLYVRAERRGTACSGNPVPGQEKSREPRSSRRSFEHEGRSHVRHHRIQLNPRLTRVKFLLTLTKGELMQTWRIGHLLRNPAELLPLLCPRRSMVGRTSVNDAPNGPAGVFGDESAPSLPSAMPTGRPRNASLVDHKAGEEFLVLAGWRPIAHNDAHHLVTGPLRAIPRSMERHDAEQ